jgi:hypothetical protein
LDLLFVHSIHIARLIMTNSLSTVAGSDQELKKLSVLLPRSIHQQLKMFAIRRDTSITTLIQQLVEDLLKGQPEA